MISPRVLERRESGKNLSDSVTEQSDDSSVIQDDPFDASFAVYPLYPSEVEEIVYYIYRLHIYIINKVGPQNAKKVGEQELSREKKK